MATGKKFATEFDKISKVKTNDRLLVWDSDTGLVKYCLRGQIVTEIEEAIEAATEATEATTAAIEAAEAATEAANEAASSANEAAEAANTAASNADTATEATKEAAEAANDAAEAANDAAEVAANNVLAIEYDEETGAVNVIVGNEGTAFTSGEITEEGMVSLTFDYE